MLCDAVNVPKKCLFQRFFVAFPIQINTLLNDCRLFIGINGCHLKGKFDRISLAAVALNANKEMIENTQMLGLCATLKA